MKCLKAKFQIEMTLLLLFGEMSPEKISPITFRLKVIKPYMQVLPSAIS